MTEENAKNPIALAVLDKLDALGISYRLLHHPPAMTMEDLTAIDQELGAAHPKNLFLCNRQKTTFYLLLLDGRKPFRTASVSRQLGVARLSFAEKEHLQQLLQTEPGGISPLGLVFDRQHKVQLVMDRSLRDCQAMAFHPCVNTASLVLPGRDFLEKFLPATGHKPTWVNIDE